MSTKSLYKSNGKHHIGESMPNNVPKLPIFLFLFLLPFPFVPLPLAPTYPSPVSHPLHQQSWSARRTYDDDSFPLSSIYFEIKQKRNTLNECQMYLYLSHALLTNIRDNSEIKQDSPTLPSTLSITNIDKSEEEDIITCIARASIKHPQLEKIFDIHWSYWLDANEIFKSDHFYCLLL